MSKLIIKSIMDMNRVIGIGGKLPWLIPEDLKDFREATINKPIIMGRKTFESFDGFLPKRKHIIITRNRNYKVPHPHQVVHSLSEAIDCVTGEPVTYIIGGGEIYEQALPFTDQIELTLVHEEYGGDSFFPPIKIKEWSFESSKSNILKDGTKLTKIIFNKIP